MHERIKKLRKALDLTQREFGERIGVKPNTIATYEIGRNQPIDAVISLICREFSVSEAWLRTGEGEMFVARTRNDEINEFINIALQDKPESFKLRLISALSRLKEDDWEVLERFAANLVQGSDALAVPVSTSAQPQPTVDAEIESQVAEFRQELLDEKEQRGKLQALQESGSSGAKLA